jgi:hypothetical protein
MSKLQQTQTVEKVVKTELAPEVQTYLSAVLSTYTDLKIQLDAIQAQMDTEKEVIKLVLEDEGVESLKISGYSLAIVKGKGRKKLNTTKLKAQGVTQAQLDAATDEGKPTKPYLSVRGSDDAATGYETADAA